MPLCRPTRTPLSRKLTRSSFRASRTPPSSRGASCPPTSSRSPAGPVPTRGGSRSARAPSSSRASASSTAARRRPTGSTRTSSAATSPLSTSTPTCSTSTTATSSPPPATPRASTCCSTCCAATSAPRPRTGSPVAPSSRRGGRAGRPSSSSGRCPTCPTRAPGRHGRGPSSTSTSRSAWPTWPGTPGRACARSPAASGRRPARRRAPGSRGLASTGPDTCSRRPTCRSTGWPPRPVSARAPRCASTSRPLWDSRPWPTVAPTGRSRPERPRPRRPGPRAPQHPAYDPSSRRERQVRVLRRAALERQDRRVLDLAVPDLDRPPDRRVRVPGLRPAHDRRQEGQQRLADLPRGGVPEVGRAVVDGVVEHVVADEEGGVGEGRRLRPAETHALVARHVDDDAARRHPLEVVVRHERDRGVGVLEHAVDDDVVLGEELPEGHRAVLGDRVAHARRRVVGVEVHDPGRVDRRRDSRLLTVRQHVDVADPERLERGDRPAGRGAEADDDRAALGAVVTGDPRDLEGVEHRAVAGELVVLVEDVEAERAVLVPVVHRLEGDERQLPVDGGLRQLGVLHAVRPAPEHLPDPQGRDVTEQGLRRENDVALRDELLATEEPADVALELVVGHAVPLAVAGLEEDPPAQLLGDPVDVLGVQWQPVLVLLEGPGHDAEAELDHARTSWWAAPCSARRLVTSARAGHDPASVRG